VIHLSREIVIDTSDLRFIEGHGRLTVSIRGDEARAEFHNLEGPRFLTAYLRGKPVRMAPIIASRICGLCYTAHSINAAETVERALGIKVAQEVHDLRKVLYLANNLRSHMMHLLYLSIPPLEGLSSILRIRDKEIYNAGASLLSKATGIIELWGGRSVHVPNVIVGGFGSELRGEELFTSLTDLQRLKRDAAHFMRYVMDLDLPDLERERTLAALRGDGSYPIYMRGPSIALGDGTALSTEAYYRGMREVTKDYSTSKHVYFDDREITVGALSRVMLNKGRLSEDARFMAEEVEWKQNPFLIIKAQAVEVIDYINELIELGERLRGVVLDQGKLAPALNEARRSSGKGIFVAEAPRGTLCHFCEVEEGTIKDFRVYTPTAVNSKSIEMDAVELIRRYRPIGMEKIKFILEDLVRSYDPCLSCAVSLDVFDPGKGKDGDEGGGGEK